MTMRETARKQLAALLDERGNFHLHRDGTITTGSKSKEYQDFKSSVLEELDGIYVGYFGDETEPSCIDLDIDADTERSGTR